MLATLRRGLRLGATHAQGARIDVARAAAQACHPLYGDGLLTKRFLTYMPPARQREGQSITMVERLQRASSAAEIQELLSRLEAKFGSAQKVHYSVAVDRLAGIGELDEAALLPLHLAIRGVKARCVRAASVAVLKACVERNNPALAANLLASLAEAGRGAEPDVRMFTDGIRACGDDWAAALHVVELMGRQGLDLDTVGYNALLFVLGRGQRLEAPRATCA